MATWQFMIVFVPRAAFDMHRELLEDPDFVREGSEPCWSSTDSRRPLDSVAVLNAVEPSHESWSQGALNWGLIDGTCVEINAGGNEFRMRLDMREPRSALRDACLRLAVSAI